MHEQRFMRGLCESFKGQVCMRRQCIYIKVWSTLSFFPFLLLLFPLTGLTGTLKITCPAQRWDVQVRVFSESSLCWRGIINHSLFVKFSYVDEYIRTNTTVKSLLSQNQMSSFFVIATDRSLIYVHFCSSIAPPGGTRFSGWHTDIQTTKIPGFYNSPSYGQRQLVTWR